MQNCGFTEREIFGFGLSVFENVGSYREFASNSIHDSHNHTRKFFTNTNPLI